MIKKIKYCIMKLRWQRNCRIGKNVVVDRAATFEGQNVVKKNSIILHTHLGYASYVGENCFIKNAVIGKYTCIANDVKTVSGTHPSREYVSVHPAFYAKETPVDMTYVNENCFDEYKWLDKQENVAISIGNDVWLGEGVRILDGVKIGDAPIIGAGAVVVKDIPAYAVAVGVPAKVIRYRFSDEQIKSLLQIQWWNKDDVWLREHAEQFRDIENFLKRMV